MRPSSTSRTASFHLSWTAAKLFFLRMAMEKKLGCNVPLHHPCFSRKISILIVDIDLGFPVLFTIIQSLSYNHYYIMTINDYLIVISLSIIIYSDI